MVDSAGLVGWRDAVPVEGTVDVPPDPRAMEGLGRNHSLETALADLVDNSIDAGATQVLIRFVRRHGWLRALYVVDNGCGMSPDTIDTAMTVGGRREYGAADLGHFGLGMKAASFSQARTLTVMSKTAGGAPVGRRWELGADRRAFRVDVVREDFVAAELDRSWGIPWSGAGTVVRWDGVTGFPATDEPGRVEAFLSRTIQSVGDHIGLVLHRILTDGKVEVALDVEDVGLGAGPRFRINPLDPFGYHRSGRPGYPKTLVARADGADIAFRCHVWPGRSTLPQFRLSEGAERRQGLYIYRRDRLLQAGGDWGGITAPDRRLQLARVAVDIDDSVLPLFRMNAEKSRVLLGPDFTHLAEQAVATDGTTMAAYIAEAEQAFRDSRRRSRERKAMMPPGKGFPPRLRRTIEDEAPTVDTDKPLDIRWRRFDNGCEDFFAVDRNQQTLWLNARYRPAILAGRNAGLNDVPLLKALLFLVVENAFHGDYLGVRDRDNIDLWQEILTAAAKVEEE